MRTYNHEWRKVRRQILARDGYRCQIGDTTCTKHATEVDHIIPIADGGPRLDPTNLRASCSQCNAARSARRATQISLQRAFDAGRRSAEHGTLGRSGGRPSRDW